MKFLQDVLEAVEDMREYDVPYHVRIAIDTDLRAGHWYTVRNKVCEYLCVHVEECVCVHSEECV